MRAQEAKRAKKLIRIFSNGTFPRSVESFRPPTKIAVTQYSKIDVLTISVTTMNLLDGKLNR
jgi:hypothetical protein